MEKNELPLAERIAFEAVYILGSTRLHLRPYFDLGLNLFLIASIEPPVKGLSLLLTDLGCSSLALYADVLRNNGKYKYASLAYEAALSVLRILERTDVCLLFWSSPR